MMRFPRDYQYEAAHIAAERNFYIAFQCGLGKSLTAVEACKRAKAEETINSWSVLIIVSPKVALEQWRYEIERQDPNVPVYVITNDDPFAAIDAEDHCYVVTYYETLLDPEIMNFTLLKRTWGVIVADEAHRFKNRQAKRYAALLKLKCERKIAMSGTPFDRSPAELWAALHWFDKERFSSFWRFAERYVTMVPGFKGTELVGVNPANKAELSALLKEYMIFRSRKQVGQHIRKIVNVQRVALSKEHKALYDKVRRMDDVVVDIGAAEPLMISNDVTMITRLLQLASWPGLLGVPEAPSAKLDWTMAYVLNNPNEPLLLFTRFRETAIELHRRLEAGGHEAGLVIGGAEPYKLQEVLAGKAKYLVGTIAAVGTAMDLPMLRTAIFVEMEWSSILMRQAADRIHRMTTTEPPQIIFLMAQRTVDWLLMRRLTDKLTDQQTFELMMETPTDEYADGNGRIEQLASELVA